MMIVTNAGGRNSYQRILPYPFPYSLPDDVSSLCLSSLLSFLGKEPAKYEAQPKITREVKYAKYSVPSRLG